MSFLAERGGDTFTDVCPAVSRQGEGPELFLALLLSCHQLKIILRPQCRFGVWHILPPLPSNAVVINSSPEASREDELHHQKLEILMASLLNRNCHNVLPLPLSTWYISPHIFVLSILQSTPACFLPPSCDLPGSPPYFPCIKAPSRKRFSQPGDLASQSIL